jgi:hypothetical protein
MEKNSSGSLNDKGASLADALYDEERRSMVYGSRSLRTTKRKLRDRRNSLRRIADKRAVLEG